MIAAAAAAVCLEAPPGEAKEKAPGGWQASLSPDSARVTERGDWEPEAAAEDAAGAGKSNRPSFE